MTTNNGLITRDDFLKPIELKTSEEMIDGFGKVRFREMDDATEAKFEMWLRPKGKDKRTEIERRIKLVMLCVVGADDKPLLSDDDWEAIKKFPPRIRNELGYHVMLVNGFIKDIETEEYEAELLGKSNS